MQLKKIEKIVLKELKKGVTPSDLQKKAFSAGMNAEGLNTAFHAIIRKNHPILSPLLSKFLNPDTTESTESQTTWDPFGVAVSNKRFEPFSRDDLRQYRTLRTHPWKVRRNLITFGLLAFLGLPLLLFIDSQDVLTLSKDSAGILFLPFMPLIWYIAWIGTLQRRLFKLILCQENNWVFFPKTAQASSLMSFILNNLNRYKKIPKKHYLENRWKAWNEKIPELFTRGNQGQDIYDEIWGDFKMNSGKTYPFYTAIFTYCITSGAGTNKKTRRYNQTIFSVPLNNELSTEFALLPEKKFKFNRKKEIETESEQFNKAFQFKYAGEKTSKEVEIIKTLSPLVQTQLLDMRKQEGDFSIAFEKELIVLSFDGRLIKKMHTSFITKVELKEKDKESLRRRMSSIFEMLNTIVPTLR